MTKSLPTPEKSKKQRDNAKMPPKSSITREKGSDLNQSDDKSSYTHEKKNKKATWKHNNAIKNFDYTTIVDWIRTVSGSENSHPTIIVKPFYERSTFPLTTTAVL